MKRTRVQKLQLTKPDGPAPMTATRRCLGLDTILKLINCKSIISALQIAATAPLITEVKFPRTNGYKA